MACRLRISIDDHDAATDFQSFDGEASDGGGLPGTAFPSEDGYD